MPRKKRKLDEITKEELLKRIKVLEKRNRDRLGLIRRQQGALEQNERAFERHEFNADYWKRQAEECADLYEQARRDVEEARKELETRTKERDNLKGSLGLAIRERDGARRQVDLLSVQLSKTRVLATALCAVYDEEGNASVSLARGIQKIVSQKELPEWRQEDIGDGIVAEKPHTDTR